MSYEKEIMDKIQNGEVVPDRLDLPLLKYLWEASPLYFGKKENYHEFFHFMFGRNYGFVKECWKRKRPFSRLFVFGRVGQSAVYVREREDWRLAMGGRHLFGGR